MKETHGKSGSMVLTCVFFTSIFMLIMLMQWRSQEALQSIMVLRADSIQKQYAAEALLYYGIDVCKKQYGLLAQTLVQRGTPLTLTFNRWPLGNEKYAQGTLEISYNKLFSITATLAEHDIKQISLSCCLEKQTVQLKDVFTITSWKKNEIRPEA